MKTQEKRWQKWIPFVLVILCAAVVRFVPAIFYKNYFDIGSYNIPWAVYGAKDPFGIYGPLLAEFGMDYPPMFPFALTFFGEAILAARMTDFWQMEMFYVKLIPVVADICLVALLYFIGKDYKIKPVWLPALLWALNPSAIYNCAFWGQTDCIMLFFLLAMGWALAKKQPELAAIAFAFGCLTKLQMCYYAPILLLGFLAMRAKPKRWITALATGGAVGFLGWLPFMRRGEWFALPLRIYFGGFDKYQYINAQAANVFAFGDTYLVPDDTALFGSFTFAHMSSLVMVLCFVWLFLYGLLVVRKRITLPVFAAALVYANLIFLFTTRQHERYQIPVMILALLCWMQTRNKHYAFLGIGYVLVTFANQFALLSGETFEGWYDSIAPAIKAVALVNLALFVYLVWIVLHTLRQDLRRAPVQEVLA